MKLVEIHGLRRELPTRRLSENLYFDLDGVRYWATISRFDDGRLAEVFLDVGKDTSSQPNLVGSPLDIMAKDLATLASLALQFGVPAETVKKALSQSLDGKMLGPLGLLLEIVS